MEFFDLVSVEEARKKLLEVFKDYVFGNEKVSLIEANNRILAEDIYSEVNLPDFNRSTVDGFAIKTEDSHGANQSIPSLLNILGEVEMGKKAEFKVDSGQAVYVPTGGMIPEGADGVVMIEYTEKLDEESLMVYKPISSGENVILKGHDIECGELALEKGRKIYPEVIGVLAALGIGSVSVYKKPRFSIISTGDEIIDLDEKLEIGMIRDINSYALQSLIENLGGEVARRKIVGDDYDLLKSEVEKAKYISDIVLISGGSSVGTKDYTHKVINSFEGEGVFVHGISIKPGKPTILGEGEGKLIVGLPGHPVSSIIVFKVIIENYILDKMGTGDLTSKTKAIMNFNFPGASGRESYQMVRLKELDGKLYEVPSFGKSGMISLLSESDGYIVIKSYEEGVYKGEERDVYLY